MQEKRQEKKGVYTPYWVNRWKDHYFILSDFSQAFTQSDQPVLETFPVLKSHFGTSSRSQVNGEPMVILHLVCKGMDVLGTPPRLVHQMFEPYFPDGTLTLIEFEFDFGTNAKVRSHGAQMESLKSIISSVSPARVLVFVSTHSDMERGDLFAGGGPANNPGPVAVEVDQVS